MNFTKKLLSGTMAVIQPIMANTTERLPENIPGRYYVDATCIDCDGCRNIAPAFFTRHDEIGFSIVHRQPSTPEEVALAEEAREGCPSDSIGNDGDVLASNLESSAQLVDQVRGTGTDINQPRIPS